MGAFSRQSDVKIEGQPGWDAGEFVTIKGVMTAGDIELVATANGNSGSITKMMEAMISDWNLYGDNNQLVPFKIKGNKNVRAIQQLPVHYMNPIVEAIDAVAQKNTLSQEEADDFLPSASARSEAS